MNNRIQKYYIYDIIIAPCNGIINRNLTHSEVLKDIRLKLCNTLTLHALLYECESWAIIEQGKHSITSTEMKFMRRMAKYTQKVCRHGENTLL